LYFAPSSPKIDSRGAYGPHRIVLVQRRDPEDGHDRVADELLDGAAVARERRLHRVEVARHHTPDRLRIEPLAEACRADQIGEDDGDDLPDLASVVDAEGCAAPAAEARVRLVLASALRADRHARERTDAPRRIPTESPLATPPDGGPQATSGCG